MNRLSLLSQYISSERQAFTKVQLTTEGAIGLITLKSTKDLNCLSKTMRAELGQALEAYHRNPKIKAIVILSSHNKVFCAGANIKEFLQNDTEYYMKHEIFTNLEDAFRNITVPIIAAVDGLALGGGFQLSLLCDIIICSQKASFGFPEITLGLIPGIGGTQRATKIIGEKATMKMILTGQPISGERAAQLGITQLVSSQNFKENVMKIVQKIASKSISSLVTGKKAVKYSTESNLSQGLQFERTAFYPLFGTKGAKEGINAFLQKRKPNFNGI